MEPTDIEDFVDPRDEAEEFERFSEDLEQYDARREAEEECAREAYWDYCDGLEARGVPGSEAISFAEFRRYPTTLVPPPPVPSVPVSQPVDEDDIPF